ncbi:hypothetical protein HK102_009628 [Quaeritorhiza haematococci]|nr:hypothetical protein HK102_009628 [Quaeritorhiza haematococci]
MRFQQALLLQKQQVEQEDLREEREMRFNPVKEAVNQQYAVTRAWFDPLTRSLERVRMKQRDMAIAALRAGVSVPGGSTAANNHS